MICHLPLGQRQPAQRAGAAGTCDPCVTLTGEQFDRTRRLALRLAGIELLDRHRELLQRRCRRIEILNPALLRAAEGGDPAAARQFLGLITTKFPEFFRHPSHFEVAAKSALQELASAVVRASGC